MSAAAFKLEIDKAWAAQFDNLKDAVEYIALQAIKKVDMRSPVDKGRFRANWTLSIGGMDAGTSEAIDPSGAATVGKNMAALAAYPDAKFPVIYLQNNLPYAEPLENGHSMQAPAGMVAITLPELAAMWEATKI